jgi:4-amino-4-deoxy-L-arabinose transferase-like glycosyltransferase
MHETGNYLMPEYHGDERVNKPPLYYWMALAASALLGEFSLLALRLPAAFASIGMVLLILAWGRLMGLTRGPTLLAMALFVVCYDVMVLSRRGGFEMAMCFFASASLYACARAALSSNPRPWGWIAALAFALGFLIKGTPMFLLVPLVAGIWMISLRRGRELLKPYLLLTAAIALLLGLSWHIYALFYSEEVRENIVGAALLPFGVRTEEAVGAAHLEPPWFFLVSIWKSAFPMALFLPLTAWFTCREKAFPYSPLTRLILLAVVVPFLVFSAIPQKREDYLLPIMPYIALLTAAALAWTVNHLSSVPRKILLLVPGLIAAGFMLFMSPIASIGFVWVADWSVLLALGFGLALAGYGIVLLRALHIRTLPTAFVAAFLGFTMVWWWYFGTMRYYEDGFGSGRIWEQPQFNKPHWDAKFAASPFLSDLLDVENGLENLEERRLKKIQYEQIKARRLILKAEGLTTGTATTLINHPTPLQGARP